jgi:hypothetical protein
MSSSCGACRIIFIRAATRKESICLQFGCIVDCATMPKNRPPNVTKKTAILAHVVWRCEFVGGSSWFDNVDCWYNRTSSRRLVSPLWTPMSFVTFGNSVFFPRPINSSVEMFCYNYKMPCGWSTNVTRRCMATPFVAAAGWRVLESLSSAAVGEASLSNALCRTGAAPRSHELFTEPFSVREGLTVVRVLASCPCRITLRRTNRNRPNCILLMTRV